MPKLLWSLTASTIALSVAAPAMAQEGDTIIVSGQRAAIERSIDAKRNAIGIIDVAAADDIGRLPDRNVAEVVERLPGVGVQYDQGEGRFVFIRGVSSALNGYTLNGFELGNPDGQTRALPLDVVSGQLLNRVEVVKVRTADLDGQGIGGSINLVTQTAFDFAGKFNIVVNGQVGYQELNKKVPVRGDALVAARFGDEEQFGITLGGSYSDRTYASAGFFPDDWRPVAGAPNGGLPINIKFTDYQLERERIGAVASLDFRPLEDTTIYVRGIYSRFTENEYRQRYRLDFATDRLLPLIAFNADGVSGTIAGTPNVGTGGGSGPERRQDLRLEYKEKSIQAIMLGGDFRPGDNLLADVSAGVVHNEVIEPNDLWQFRCNPGTVDFDFTEEVFTALPRTQCDASQMGFRQYTRQNEIGDEDIFQARGSLTLELPTLGSGSFLRAGAKFRDTKKSFDSANDRWDRGSSANRFTLAQFDLTGADVTIFPDNTNTSHGFLITPTIDRDAIQAFTQTNLNGPRMVINASTTLSNGTLNDFRINETVSAAFAMANVEFGPVTLTPGIRYEHTSSDIVGFRLEGGNTVVPAQASNSYEDWLPSVIARIKPAENVIVRLAWSRALARPNYSDLSPGGALSFEDGTAPGTFNGGFSSGNADLLPYRADSFDATAEWYFGTGNLIAVAAFAKLIDNPIFRQTQLLTDIDFADRRFETLSLTQPFNADNGKIYGIEAVLHYQFTALPGLLSGFGVELTGTLIDSELELPDGRVSTFPQQSDLLFGGKLFYERGPIEASLGYHHTGRSLLQVGGEEFEDQYDDDLRRLDAKLSVELFEGLTVFAEAQNLTDEPTRQYQGGNRVWTIQNERYGRTFWAGFSAQLR